MSSTKELIKFLTVLFLITAVTFAVHIVILHFLDKPLYANLIVWAYVSNALVAGAILAFLLKAPPSLKNSLGFLFMGGSFLKFALYFIFFLPLYKEDGGIDNYEFSTFFVPYAVCLILETTLLINKLNRV
jgi:hypothetical protein